MIKRITYRRYKKFYSDARTIKGSYDAYNKTIQVDVPAEKFHLYDLPELEEGDKIVLMPYLRYKEHYKDCETVQDSYDFENRTIRVVIRHGREKASGTRGKRYYNFTFDVTDNNGKKMKAEYKAVSIENAKKRLLKECKEFGWTYTEE